MVLLGHIQNGMIVTDSAVPLPEGANVRIEFLQDELDSRDASGNPQEWTEQLDDRRCHLIDREIAGTLSIDESIELTKLQKAMLDYRRKVAPLPIESARRLRKELLAEIGCDP